MDDFVEKIFGYLIVFAIVATIVFYLVVYVAPATILFMAVAGGVAGGVLSIKNFIVALWRVYGARIRSDRGVQA